MTEARYIECALNPDSTRGAWYVYRRTGRWSGYKRVAADGPGTRMEASRLTHKMQQKET